MNHEKPKFASDDTIEAVRHISISEMADRTSEDLFKAVSSSQSTRDFIRDNTSKYGSGSQDIINQQQPGMISQISQCTSSAQLAPSAFATSSVICIECNKLKHDKLFWEAPNCDHSYTICKNCIRVYIRRCIETGEKEIKCLYPECSVSISKDYIMYVIQQEVDKDLLIKKLNSLIHPIPISAAEPGAVEEKKSRQNSPAKVKKKKKKVKLKDEPAGCKCIIL